MVEYEIPAFIADKAAVRNGTGEAYFATNLTPNNTVYTMWIGTNDVGVGAFLTNSQIPGTLLTNYTDCVFSAFDTLYANGGRYFVLFNLAPLHLTPLYANDSQGGVGPVHAWPDKPGNHTAIAEQMHEYVTTLNNVYRYQLPFEVLLSARYPGSNFALFDVYNLVRRNLLLNTFEFGFLLCYSSLKFIQILRYISTAPHQRTSQALNAIAALMALHATTRSMGPLQTPSFGMTNYIQANRQIGLSQGNLCAF